MLLLLSKPLKKQQPFILMKLNKTTWQFYNKLLYIIYLLQVVLKMSDSEEEDTDISESELESYAESCYDQLNQGGQMMKVSEDSYNCPFCCGKKKQTFSFNALLQHAAGVSQGSSKRRTKDRGKHLGLKKYMQRANNGESSSGNIVDKDERELNEVFVWPCMGVMANISVGESGSKLRDELTKKGFNPVRVNPLWNFKGHSGYAIVEFRNDFLGLFDALRFEKAYEACHQGKRNYFGIAEKGDKIYCWVARDDDFHSGNKIGDYLQKNGNLKTIAQYHQEEKNKNNRLVSKLTNTVEVQNMQIREIETKYKETYISLCSLISEKDEMVRAFDKGLYNCSIYCFLEVIFVFSFSNKADIDCSFTMVSIRKTRTAAGITGEYGQAGRATINGS